MYSRHRDGVSLVRQAAKMPINRLIVDEKHGSQPPLGYLYLGLIGSIENLACE